MMDSKVTVEVPEGISMQAKKKAHEAAVMALWEAGDLSASRAAAEPTSVSAEGI